MVVSAPPGSLYPSCCDVSSSSAASPLYSSVFDQRKLQKPYTLRAFGRYMIKAPCYIKPTRLLAVVTVFISWRLNFCGLLGLVLQRSLCWTTLLFPFLGAAVSVRVAKLLVAITTGWVLPCALLGVWLRFWLNPVDAFPHSA